MLEAALSIGESLKEITILGDFADFYSVSSHAKDPRIFSMLEDEVVAVLDALNELDNLFPSVQKVFLVGNHSYRLERYLCDRAPALFGITSIEHLFEFNRRPRWRVVPYGPNQKHAILNSKLFARHEPIGRSAEATARKAMCSLVFGHIHRIQSNYAVGMDGTQHVAFSPGWLGDKRHGVFDYVKSHHDWQLGFALVNVDPKTGFFYHQIIPILETGNGKVSACVNGKIFKG